MSDNFTGIELADAIQAVRDELLTAAARGTGRDLRFEVGDINLEFTVELRRDARLKSGVRAWVISADADAGLSTARAHRVSFTLRPKNTQTSGGWEVGNDAPADTSAFGRTE
ncbi:trypco2 family protein [Streptomyces chiangmaiensis]|uniref:Trypco2 family protein n=1 Tax=Streptomyces chiangmaiensis TaxID=766497 RepID=A0ABU7FHX0_9ACTN|nr:trypco2 family protein [Streptomyces chiangmaiensis]MED7823722.1 trypco2 family protein [Streptomyces chiangmaiensis]